MSKTNVYESIQNTLRGDIYILSQYLSDTLLDHIQKDNTILSKRIILYLIIVKRTIFGHSQKGYAWIIVIRLSWVLTPPLDQCTVMQLITTKYQ